MERPEFLRFIDRLAEAQSHADFAEQHQLAEDATNAAALSARLRKSRRRNRLNERSSK
jgi:hypothetical protein